jgi:hypothetical protein
MTSHRAIMIYEFYDEDQTGGIEATASTRRKWHVGRFLYTQTEVACRL